jgi:predicted TPR repeat methyltransferase
VDDYVRKTFDRFADSFDSVLKNLDYKAPFLVEKAFREVSGLDHSLDVLDAGCGTGLCGPLLRPSVGRLTGVDLSDRMLARAKQRQVYDELIEAELTAFLNQSEAVFDVIVSADVLCYFGDLSPALGASARALKPGGHLIFTVETLDAEQEVVYQLNAHGRYSHGQHYVKQSLAVAGLTLISLESVILRLESGKPVGGFLVTAQK